MQISRTIDDPHYEFEQWALDLTDDDRTRFSNESGIPLKRFPPVVTFDTGACFDDVVFEGPYDDPVEALLAPVAERLRKEKLAEWAETDARAWAERNGFDLVSQRPQSDLDRDLAWSALLDAMYGATAAMVTCEYSADRYARAVLTQLDMRGFDVRRRT